MSYPDDEDGYVLSEIAARGVDMTQPLVIDFFVAAPDEESANEIEAALKQAGYDAHAEYDEGEADDEDDDEFGPSWTVFATIQLVPEYDEILRVQSELDKIADPYGGHADGWGVMLDEDEDEDEG